MQNAYYSISFDDAKKFLKSLPEDKLSDLYDLYSIKSNADPYYSAVLGKEDTNEEYTKDELIEAVAAIISDEDLFKLGFAYDLDDEIEESVTTDCKYNYNFNDVVTFLNSLDEDTIYDLLHKYDAVDVEDLAVGITDAELVSLGFDMINNAEVDMQFTDSSCNQTTSCCSNDFGECVYMSDLCDKYDFFEDVSYSIPILVVDPDNLIFGVHGDYYYNSLKSQLDPYLVSSCDKLNSVDDYDGFSGSDLIVFKIVPVEYPEQIQEDVVINSELNPALFDNNTQQLKPDVHEQLIQYIEKFEQKMSDKSIDVSCSDVQLVGSNAGYLYTPESDIDIHFIWSYPMDKDNFDQMRAEFVDYMMENPLVIDGYGVELNLEDGMNMEAAAKRRYSLITDNWVDNSNTEEVYTADDVVKVDGYESVVDEYTKRIDDVIKNNSYADAVQLKQEIRTNRSEDLASVGSLSMGNVVFKELRNSGKFGELREFIKSKELTQDEPKDKE